jgi:putative aldouronate transport system permease protein
MRERGMNQMHAKKVKLPMGDKIFNVLNYSICALIALSIIYPLYFVVIASFSDPDLINQGKVWLLPAGISLDAYKQVFETEEIWTGYFNTIIYTAGSVLLSLLFTLPAAYALSRKDFSLRRILTVYFLIPMFFNGGLIPTYMVIRDLGLIDTYWVMVVPMSVNVFYLIIARTFYSSQIPDELRQAAEIDGCSNTRFFVQIALPLTSAIIAVIGLYVAVGSWNSYMNALIYLQTEEKNPLQIILRNILVVQTAGDINYEAQRRAQMLRYALVIVSTLPIMSVYPFIQKYFTKGALLGSIKG